MQSQDLVFHFAAQSNIALSSINADAEIKNGVLATVNVLESMKDHGIHQLIFASSGSVYGLTDSLMQESSTLPSPISIYAANKIASESFIHSYSYLFDIQSLICRFSNIVGSRIRRGVIHDFILQLREHPDYLQILGDGNQYKPFMTVSDCIDAILYTYGHVLPNPVATFNISTNTRITVNDIATIVMKAMNLTDVELRYSGGSQGWSGDQPVVHLDTSALSALGWHPQNSALSAIVQTTRSLLQEL